MKISMFSVFLYVLSGLLMSGVPMILLLNYRRFRKSAWILFISSGLSIGIGGFLVIFTLTNDVIGSLCAVLPSVIISIIGFRLIIPVILK